MNDWERLAMTKAEQRLWWVTAHASLTATLLAEWDKLDEPDWRQDSRTREAMAQAELLVTRALQLLPPASDEDRPCDDCGLPTGYQGDFIVKGDHHGGLKRVCADRDACNARPQR